MSLVGGGNPPNLLAGENAAALEFLNNILI